MTTPEPPPVTPQQQVSLHRRALRHLRHFITLLVLALLGAGIAVISFGAQTFRWRAFDVQVRILPSLHGSTEIRFIPLGSVRAVTHKLPVVLQISLMSIDFDRAKALISHPPPPRALELEFRSVARHDLTVFALRQIAAGAIGGLLAPILLRPRRFRIWLLSCLMGGGYVALVLLLAISRFNPRAFETPVYTGALQQAEWVVTLVKDGFNKVEALSVKLRNVATNLSRLYERINAVPAEAADVNTITVLHISDIHNNPAAVAFVRQLVQGTHVDLVVDTGDLTDFGIPLEAEITKSLKYLSVPYVFVAGNHDSQAIIKAVQANKNAYVLNGAPVDVDGLRFLGTPDPSAVRGGAPNVNTSPAEMNAAATRLAGLYQAMDPPPDLVCVHDPLQAAQLIGKAPVILCGHEHRSYVEVDGPTVVCNAGTTGAAGARYFDRPNGVPMSASILNFTRTPRPRLLFIDRVVLDGTLGEYTITRKSFQAADTPPAMIR